MVSANPIIPICPKCGYDQRGEIATWESVCPLDGRCPECGLGFAWGEVFDPLLNDVYWYGEHAKSIRGMVWRMPMTLLKLVFPIRFWRTVDVKKSVNPWRLVFWAILCIVLVHLLVSVPNGFRAWDEQNWSGKSTLTGHYRAHGGYGIAEIIVDGIAYPFFDAYPFSAGRVPGLRFAIGWSDYWYNGLWKPLGFQIGFIVLWLVVLIAIPQTRKLIQLRGVHVFRAAVLSVLVMALCFELTRLNFAIYRISGLRYYRFSWFTSMLVPVAVLWQMLFWGSAVVVGWRVCPCKLLVALGTITALLGGSVLRVYVFIASTQ